MSEPNADDAYHRKCSEAWNRWRRRECIEVLYLDLFGVYRWGMSDAYWIQTILDKFNHVYTLSLIWAWACGRCHWTSCRAPSNDVSAFRSQMNDSSAVSKRWALSHWHSKTLDNHVPVPTKTEYWARTMGAYWRWQRWHEHEWFLGVKQLLLVVHSLRLLLYGTPANWIGPNKEYIYHSVSTQPQWFRMMSLYQLSSYLKLILVTR